MDGASRRKAERKSVSLLVKVKHQNVMTFEEDFATNLSDGGMFIRSRQPQPVGTHLKFEVQLAGGERMMRGTAVVRWIRLPGDPEGGPGMGVQFEQLDDATRALVDRLLAKPTATAAPSTAKPTSPSTEELPPELAALEAEVAARYGSSSAAPGLPAIAPVAPVVPPATPAIAPVAPVIPPVAPASTQRASAKPATAATAAPSIPAARQPQEPLDLSGLDLDLAPPVSPGADADEPLVPSFEMPIEFETTPLPADAVEIPIDALLEATPSPPTSTGGELAFEFDAGGAGASDEVEVPILDLTNESPEWDQPALAAPPETARPSAASTGVAAPARPQPSVAPSIPAAQPTAPSASRTPATSAAPATHGATSAQAAFTAPSTSAAPGSTATATARASPSTRSIAPVTQAGAPAAPRSAVPAGPPSAPARASSTAAPSGAASSLPQVRRDAPPDEAPMPTPTLLRAEPKPEAGPAKSSGPVFLKPPEKLADTGPVVGIDLGTTNSCVALFQNGKPVVLRSKEGYNTVPSVISLTNAGKLLLAHRAKSQLVLNPTQTIYGAKRLVGRPYDSAIVSQVKEHFHYEVVPDEHGRAAVKLGQHVLSLEEVQGLILRECRELAEQQLGKSVGRAVITVPAYYSEPQREAVRRAGAMAGLKVERILNEPTAAALAFGLNKELNKKILVYDLGGGTFDATILNIEKNVFEVLATGGDVFLGGVDFDNSIVSLLLERFHKQEGIPFDGDQVALSRVSDAAEKAKVALSERTTYEVHIPMLMMDAQGKPRDLRTVLKREDVEQITMTLVTRTLDVVRDVLLDAKLRPQDVDDILLVGGMSRMPLVREKLKEMFGKVPHAGVNADEAVALGAALYCGTVDKVSSVTLIDVLPMTVGIGMPGGGFKRAIERNTPLPAQRSFALSTSADNETTIEFSVFQGEEPNVAGNEYLGTVRVEGLPKMPKGMVKVAITLRLDSECVLHVEANEMTTRKAVKATLATRYTSEEVQQKLGISAEKAREVEAARSKELGTRSGGFWGFLKRVVGRK